MTTYIGIGFSQQIDTAEAAREAAALAKASLKRTGVNLAIVFSTIHYDPQIFLPIIYDVFDKANVTGCSSAGIILSDQISLRGLSILLIKSDDIHFSTGCIHLNPRDDIRLSGISLAKDIINRFGQARRQAFIFFADGLLQNNSLILKGVQEILGSGFPIMGAGSCDDFHFEKSYQFYQDKAFSNSSTGLLMGGHMNISLGSKHGWRPLGKPRTITKSDGHIIHTIDGKKASLLYEEYFGEKSQEIQANKLGKLTILYPLGIYLEDEKEYLLRNAINILEDGSIVCQDAVPEGTEVHLMIGNKDSCKQAAIDAAQEVQRNLFGKTPKLIMVFESLARHKLLGRASLEEIKIIKKILGPETPLIGMYSHGEISPFQSLSNIKRNYLQNESIVIFAIA